MFNYHTVIVTALKAKATFVSHNGCNRPVFGARLLGF